MKNVNELVNEIKKEEDFYDELEEILREAEKQSLDRIGLYYDVYYDFNEEKLTIKENSCDCSYPDWNAICLKTFHYSCYPDVEIDIDDIDREYYEYMINSILESLVAYS